MTNWKPIAITFGITLLGLIVAASSHVWGACERDTLTFDESVSLPGVVLPAGHYSFTLADTTDLVVVRSADGTETFYIGFTNTVHRPQGLPPTQSIAFGAAPEGEPQPITVWYPSGGALGHEFRY